MDYTDTRLVSDIAGLDRLKAKARQDQSAALSEVADQFESLLVSMMVKSMRQASLGEGLLDSRQSLFYRDMLDQQLTAHLAEKGIGLAEVIERQLGGKASGETLPGRDAADYLAARVPQAAAVSVATEPADREVSAEPVLDSPSRFVERLMPWAREAAAELGIAPEALLAQAALETGWGRSVIHGSGGGNSHNLFGIKADPRWDGDRVVVSTLEYMDGVAVRRKDPFRAYSSYRDSFRDYVDFLRGGSRYREALQQTGDPRAYFAALQSAGYATDPDYSDKVLRVLNGREMRAALERLELQADAAALGPDDDARPTRGG
jgi:flagellar protein FlgJ